MATVSTSLKMFDMMTRPLRQITNALNSTISAMDTLNNSANKDIKVTNSLNSAKESIKRANAAFQQLATQQDKVRNNQERLNNSFNDGAKSSDGLISKIKGLFGAYLGFQAVKKGIDLTLGGAARLEQQLITISGMLGNKDVGKAFFGQLNKYANESVYGLKEFNTITRSFIQFTKNTDKLMGLNKTAEKLAFLDPSQGLEGAGFALKEALGGDFMSLKSRFGFGKADAEILKASKSMDEFINKFNKLLEKKGATDKALEEFNQSAVAQMSNLKSNIETSLSQAGQRGLEILKPLLTKINEGFKNGSFQSFFDSIGAGLSFIVGLSMNFINVIEWIGNAVSNNWGIIEPILWGIIAALIVYNATMGIAWLTTLKDIVVKGIHAIASWAETAAIFALILAQDGLNAALMACPLMWIIMGIIALIVIFYAAVAAVNHFAGTSISATGIVGGCFGVLWAGIYNGIAFVWNHVASFVEFFANVFNHPLYSVKTLFANIWNNIVGFVGKALDAIVDMVKKIPFLGDLVGDFSSSSFKVDPGPAPSDYWKAPRMEMKDFKDEFKKGYDMGSNLADKAGNIFKLDKILDKPKIPNLDKWNKAQGPGTLSMSPDKNKLGKHAKGANDHLKNIDDKIDISNEHLEMLKDLAEQESIQNFTTLSPSVSIQTGDIKEEADINKIISKIENYMENELVNSAEGVYA